MLRLFHWVLLSVMLCPVAWGQEPSLQQPKIVAHPPVRAKQRSQTYVVQLTEFHLKDAANPGLSTDQIVQTYQQLAKEGELDVVETIRLTALEGHQSLVQVGRRATVTVGMVSAGPGRGTNRQTRQEMIGTMVTVTAEPQEQKILLKLAYESARLEEKDSEEDPADTITQQFQTSLLLEPGEPELVGGSSAGSSAFLVVEIEKGE